MCKIIYYDNKKEKRYDEWRSTLFTYGNKNANLQRERIVIDYGKGYSISNWLSKEMLMCFVSSIYG